MKTLKLSVAAFAAAGLLASCGGGMKGDIDKMAKLACSSTEAQLALTKNPEDAKAKEALEKANKEMEEFSKKMDAKYKDKKEDKEMTKYAEEAFKKCKAVEELSKLMEEQAAAAQAAADSAAAAAMAADTASFEEAPAN